LHERTFFDSRMKEVEHLNRLNFTGSPTMKSYREERWVVNHNEGIGRPVSGGFTLLEILVVVFILSLLAAIVAPRIIGRTDDARIAEAKVQIRNIETALKLYKMDNGFYPETQQGLDALIEKPSSGMVPRNYREGGYLEQKKVPLDPWGNPYVYVSPGLHGDFDLLSFGADGKEGGEGKNADITNWDMQ
jgi:general secretion pathway protein G